MANNDNRGILAGLAGGLTGGTTVALIDRLLAKKPVSAAPADEKFDYIIELLEAILAKPSMELTTEQVELLASSLAEAPTRVPSITIPMAPRTLSEIIMAMAAKIEGICWVYKHQFAWDVAAGATQIFTNITPDNWTTILDEGIVLRSDFYSEDIILYATIGGEYVATGAPLTTEIVVPWGVFKPVPEHTEITVTIINATPVDIVVSLSQVALGLENSYFENFYLPAIEKSYTTVQELLDFIKESQEYAASLY